MDEKTNENRDEMARDDLYGDIKIQCPECRSKILPLSINTEQIVFLCIGEQCSFPLQEEPEVVQKVFLVNLMGDKEDKNQTVIRIQKYLAAKQETKQVNVVEA